MPETTNNTLENFSEQNSSKFLKISSPQIDYLCQKYQIKDSPDLFTWGIHLLYDLSKLDEQNWHLTLTKCTIDEDLRITKYDKTYSLVHFFMKWLSPKQDSFVRPPSPETLNKMAKLN